METKCTSLLVAVVAAVAFVGCTSDDDFAPQRESSGVKQSLTFTANVDGGSAKCYAYGRQKTHLMIDGCSVAFDAGDAISVFDGAGNNEFRTEDGGTSVYLTGEAVETANYTALYPYQSGASLSGTTLTATLPTEQNAVADSYDPQANLSVATTTREAMSFGFKNVCALVQFDTAEPLKKVVFHGNNSEKVAGALSIDMSNADAPTVTGSATNITLLPAEGEAAIPAGTYYIAVLPQEFSQGFTLEAYTVSSTTNEADYSLNTPAITLQRRGIMDVRLLNANGYDYADLGIVVGGYKVLWATMNVGASAPEKYGDYFAWGETQPYYNSKWTGDGKTSFSTPNNTWKSGKTAGYATGSYQYYKSSAYTKYTATDKKTVLDLIDDAARANWGGAWCMPTKAELDALITTSGKNTTKNSVAVRSYTANGQTIYLPYAGGFADKAFNSAGTAVIYWSSTLYSSGRDNAYRLILDKTSGSASYATGTTPRVYGQNVRAVLRIPVSQ